jgi:hypothetical protein
VVKKPFFNCYNEGFKGGSTVLKKMLILFPIFLLVFSTAFSQGRGGRQGSHQGQGRGQGLNQGGAWGNGQAGGVGEMDQKRIHTTQQQRNQINSCNKLADDIKKQARKMAQVSGDKFNLDEANKQRSQIQAQFRTMEQEHEQLMNGLDTTQNQAWQEQINNMNQFRQKLNLQLHQMDAELGAANPDSRQIAEGAKEMERIMNNWRKEYNALSSQAGGF